MCNFFVDTLDLEHCATWSEVFRVAETEGSFVVCCLNKTSSPIAYTATGTGIHGKPHNLVVAIGAGFVAFPHCDTKYADRVSVILNDSLKVRVNLFILLLFAVISIFSLLCSCVDLVYRTQRDSSRKSSFTKRITWVQIGLGLPDEDSSKGLVRCASKTR